MNEPRIITPAERAARKLKSQEEAAKVAFPSRWQMLKNLMGSMGDLVTQGTDMRSPEEVERVLKICAECPYFREKGPRCAHCGCFLLVKVKATALKCPIDKW